jgi:hypothetical protein
LQHAWSQAVIPWDQPGLFGKRSTSAFRSRNSFVLRDNDGDRSPFSERSERYPAITPVEWSSILGLVIPPHIAFLFHQTLSLHTGDWSHVFEVEKFDAIEQQSEEPTWGQLCITSTGATLAFAR